MGAWDLWLSLICSCCSQQLHDVYLLIWRHVYIPGLQQLVHPKVARRFWWNCNSAPLTERLVDASQDGRLLCQLSVDVLRGSCTVQIQVEVTQHPHEVRRQT